MKEGLEYQQFEKQLAEAANKHDFGYNQDDWQEVLGMLDEDKKRNFLPIWLKGLGVLLVVLMSYTVYHVNRVVSSDFSTTPESIQQVATTQEHITKTTSLYIEESNEVEVSDLETRNEAISNNDYKPGQEPISSIAPKRSMLLNEEVINNEKEREGFQQLSPLAPTTIDANKLNIHSSIAHNKSGSRNDMLNNSPVLVTDDHQKRNIQEDILLKTEKSSSYLLSTTTLRSMEIARVNSLLSSLPIVDPQVAIPLIAEDLAVSKKKILLSGFVGLESSSTPNSDLSQVDLALGVQVSYLIGNKWSLDLKGQYIDDSYLAEQGDYTQTEEFWRNSGAPDYTNANCNMLDFSLGTTYYFKDAYSPGWNVGAALNSNFMLSETYEYNYRSTESQWTWQTGAGNNTLLSSFEITLGHSLPLTKTKNISIQSYYRVPTRGIGHGQVRLSSLGARIAVPIN